MEYWVSTVACRPRFLKPFWVQHWCWWSKRKPPKALGGWCSLCASGALWARLKWSNWSFHSWLQSLAQSLELLLLLEPSMVDRNDMIGALQQTTCGCQELRYEIDQTYIVLQVWWTYNRDDPSGHFILSFSLHFSGSYLLTMKVHFSNIGFLITKPGSRWSCSRFLGHPW